MTDGPLLVRPEDARKVASPPIGINCARDLVRRGEWQSVKVGRRTLVVMASVMAWIEREAAKNGNGAESYNERTRQGWVCRARERWNC